MCYYPISEITEQRMCIYFIKGKQALFMSARCSVTYCPWVQKTIEAKPFWWNFEVSPEATSGSTGAGGPTAELL